MKSGFTQLGAITAPGNRFNEDAYGIWPQPQFASAAWVLDGVTGINPHALLPEPTDAAWFVAQVQQLLPTLLAREPDRDIRSLIRELVAKLDEIQNRSWREGLDHRDGETPAASFTLVRQIGDEVEIARLGDCPIILEKRDSTVTLIDDPILSEIEAGLKARVLTLRASGIKTAAAILQEMLPALRAVRQRRNQPDGYGVLSTEPACLDKLQLDRFPARDIRHLLLLSDGYYRLVDIYGRHSDGGLLRDTITFGPAEMLKQLRDIEAGDTTGEIYPRLKMADDATALLLGMR